DRNPLGCFQPLERNGVGHPGGRRGRNGVFSGCPVVPPSNALLSCAAFTGMSFPETFWPDGERFLQHLAGSDATSARGGNYARSAKLHEENDKKSGAQDGL